MKQLAIWIGLAAAACAAPQQKLGWVRVDGQPVVPIQFEAAVKSCNGQAEEQNQSLSEGYYGCMAEKGYLQRAAD